VSRVAVDELAAEARGSGAAHVVLTGGEPMMFAAIEPLAEALRAAGLHITIETAGTVFRRVDCDLMSISPKLASSTPHPGDPRDPDGAWRERHERRRLDLRALQQLIDSYAERQLKFVITGPTDLDEIEALLSKLQGWSARDIMLMPEGVATPSAEQKAWLVSQCIRRGWTYCPRLHIELFGHRRGT
jgi:7-carboxy-7-deazaguanine synthase